MSEIKTLQAILKNAPKGATHFCHRGFYWLISKACDDSTGSSFLFYSTSHENWLRERVTDERLRSLSDLKNIIDLLERIESLDDDNTSAFGDGWYDGFIEAKKLGEDKDFYLEDIKEDEVRNMSEHAESKYADSKLKQDDVA